MIKKIFRLLLVLFFVKNIASESADTNQPKSLIFSIPIEIGKDSENSMRLNNKSLSAAQSSVKYWYNDGALSEIGRVEDAARDLRLSKGTNIILEFESKNITSYQEIKGFLEFYYLFNNKYHTSKIPFPIKIGEYKLVSKNLSNVFIKEKALILGAPEQLTLVSFMDDMEFLLSDKTHKYSNALSLIRAKKDSDDLRQKLNINDLVGFCGLYEYLSPFYQENAFIYSEYEKLNVDIKNQKDSFEQQKVDLLALKKERRNLEEKINHTDENEILNDLKRKHKENDLKIEKITKLEEEIELNEEIATEFLKMYEDIKKQYVKLKLALVPSK